MNARIAEDIKHNAQSRFVREGKGIFALRPTSPVVASEQKNASPSEKTKHRSRTKSLLFRDAAAQILERFGRRKPMHYREITRLAMEQGLIATAGKTPEATLLAQIGTDINRRERRGERSRFTRHGRGYVGLARWTANGLAFQIEQHNEHVRKEIHARIRALSFGVRRAREALLVHMGFEAVEVSGGSGDGGIDVRGVMVTGDVIRTRMAVQVKHWKTKSVEPAVVREVRGSLGTHEQGLIITSSTFSKSAREEAERANATPVGLMDGEQLVTPLIEHEIGVRRRQENILELENKTDGEPSMD